MASTSGLEVKRLRWLGGLSLAFPSLVCVRKEGGREGLGMGLVLELRGTYIYVVSGVCGSTYYYYETPGSFMASADFQSSTMPCGERGVVEGVLPPPPPMLPM